MAAVGWEWPRPENVNAMAKAAIDEGKIGVYEDKLNKIKNKVKGTMVEFKGVKTCGLIKDDPRGGSRSTPNPWVSWPTSSP